MDGLVTGVTVTVNNSLVEVARADVAIAGGWLHLPCLPANASALQQASLGQAAEGRIEFT